METIICEIHNNSIIVFEKDEEYLYNDKIEGTIIFYDSLGKKYLKKYAINYCDENCEIIKRILK